MNWQCTTTQRLVARGELGAEQRSTEAVHSNGEPNGPVGPLESVPQEYQKSPRLGWLRQLAVPPNVILRPSCSSSRAHSASESRRSPRAGRSHACGERAGPSRKERVRTPRGRGPETLFRRRHGQIPACWRRRAVSTPGSGGQLEDRHASLLREQPCAVRDAPSHLLIEPWHRPCP